MLQAVKSKKKRKYVIPIQRNALSRRLQKTRGSGPATQGRPRKEKAMRMQLVIQDNDENDGGNMSHKLPNKKRRSVAKHNLMAKVVKQSNV